MPLRIVSDSSINILSVPGTDYRTVPLRIYCGKEAFTDEAGLDVRGMCDFLVNSREKSSTSCPNIIEWREAFEGADRVLALTISSALSGSYNSCRQAMTEYLEENPGTKGFVMDSLSTGPMMHMLLDKAVALDRQGLPFDELVEELKNYRAHSTLFFTLKTMNNMARNGRVSPMVAKMASILGIRLLAMGDEEGKVKPVTKCRGAGRLPGVILEEMIRHSYNGGKTYIHHCFAEDLTERIRELILNQYPEAEIIEAPVGGLCAYYAEPGGLILSFEHQDTAFGF